MWLNESLPILAFSIWKTYVGEYFISSNMVMFLAIHMDLLTILLNPILGFPLPTFL
jgi:hypothetical protein